MGWPYCEVGKGWTCAGYAAKGWCRSDRCLSPSETGGVYACGNKLKSPEDNCCACGGGSKQPSCASEGQSCGWNNDQTQSCCDGMQCKPFVGGSNMQCVRAPPSCAREGQSCGWNNAQTQSCCDDVECTPFLGGSDMQCVKKQSTCVAQGDYCGGPGQRTLECCSGYCQYPPNSDTMVCGDDAMLEAPSKGDDAMLEAASTGHHAMLEAASTGICTDTPNWNNGYSRCVNDFLRHWPFCEAGKGWTCAGYAAKGWCRSDRCLSPSETGGVY